MDQKKANLGSPKCFKRTLLGITNKCGTNGSFLIDERVLKKKTLLKMVIVHQFLLHMEMACDRMKSFCQV